MYDQLNCLQHLLEIQYKPPDIIIELCSENLSHVMRRTKKQRRFSWNSDFKVIGQERNLYFLASFLLNYLN